MGKEDLIKAQQLWYMLKSDLEHYNDVVMTLVGRKQDAYIQFDFEQTEEYVFYGINAYASGICIAAHVYQYPDGKIDLSRCVEILILDEDNNELGNECIDDIEVIGTDNPALQD